MEQDLHVLSIDGVVSGTADPKDPQSLRPSVTVKQLLLMPAARAEIVMPNTNSSEQDSHLILRTRGLETGGSKQSMPRDPTKPADRTNYVGDPWPAADLADVIMKGKRPAADIQALLATSFSRSGDIPMEARAFTNPVIPDHCVTLPSGAYRRRITFQQDDNFFSLGSEVVDAAGKSIDGSNTQGPNTIAPRPFQHAIPPQSEKHVCARLRTSETWELVNQTNELHNFHIHQTKFRLARPGDRGVPNGFKFTDAIDDPAAAIKDQVPEFGSTLGVAAVDIWHDTIPVPPGKFDAQGTLLAEGRVLIDIPFEDSVQVGTFVFHCHILEHEDKGMMATVEVFDPADPSASRRGADAGTAGSRLARAFCGKEPPFLTQLPYLSDSTRRTPSRDEVLIQSE